MDLLACLGSQNMYLFTEAHVLFAAVGGAGLGALLPARVDLVCIKLVLLWQRPSEAIDVRETDSCKQLKTEPHGRSMEHV